MTQIRIHEKHNEFREISGFNYLSEIEKLECEKILQTTGIAVTIFTQPKPFHAIIDMKDGIHIQEACGDFMQGANPLWWFLSGIASVIGAKTVTFNTTRQYVRWVANRMKFVQKSEYEYERAV